MRAHITKHALLASAVVLALAASPTLAAAQEDPTALAKKTQNPVGDLVSMPFQFNFNTGGAFDDATFYAELPARGADQAVAALFLTPAQPGGVMWGVGAVLSFPTATNDAVRTGAWAAGPSVVLLAMPGPWVIGALANQPSTFHDEGGAPEVTQFLIQPFVNYNFGQGWAFSSTPII
ncbi:MAG: hypothetical protein ACREMV_02915, partial [Gemmatimonadales bacterium]